jgi:threonine/homoserine/homoserine lactone efflux protein
MSLWEWLSLVSVCLAGAASPGPSLAVILGAGLSGGRASGLAAAWAHAIGVGLYAALTVLGISALITDRQWLFVGIQSAGALYLLWLAWGMVRAAESAAPDTTDHETTSSALRDGFAIAFLNPKLAIFMLALFSQFVHPGAGPLVNTQLIATATLVDGLWYSFIILVLMRGQWIEGLRRNTQTINRIFAALLATLAVIILLRTVL